MFMKNLNGLRNLWLLGGIMSTVISYFYEKIYITDSHNLEHRNHQSPREQIVTWRNVIDRTFQSCGQLLFPVKTF